MLFLPKHCCVEKHVLFCCVLLHHLPIYSAQYVYYRAVTLGRLVLALVKFCYFEIFRFSVYFNLANSWKISELEKWFLTWYLANAIAHASN